MDLQRTDNKHWHFALGPVEKWIVISGAALLMTFVSAVVGGAIWFGRNVLEKFDDQAKTDKEQTVQLAVANGQLLTLTSQLSDVPQIRRDVVKLEVRVGFLEEAERERRQTRGAR